MVEKARRQLTLAGNTNQSDPAEWQKLQEVESHLGKCMDARRIGDWKSALREADAAIANGADSSQLVIYLSRLVACDVFHCKDSVSHSRALFAAPCTEV